MNISSVLTNPALWGQIAGLGQALTARDPTAFGNVVGQQAQNLAQAELYRQQVKKQQEAEAAKKKQGIGGGIGRAVGSVLGFVGGGPVGAAIGSEAGSYAGERLAGGDPSSTPILPHVINAATDIGMGEVGKALTAGNGTDLAMIPPDNTLPTVGGTAPAFNPAAPVDSMAIQQASDTANAVVPNSAGASAALGGSSGGIISPEMKKKLLQALAYSTPDLLRASQALAGNQGTVGGGGYAPQPPLSAGAFGMRPEAINALNELVQSHWAAGTKAQQGQQELGLKERQVSAEEKRVQAENTRAQAELLRALHDPKHNWIQVHTRQNGTDGTLLIDPNTQDQRFFPAQLPKPHIGQATVIDRDPNSPTYGKPVLMQTVTKDPVNDPLGVDMTPLGEVQPKGASDVVKNPQYHTVLDEAGNSTLMQTPPGGGPATPVLDAQGQPVVSKNAPPPKAPITQADAERFAMERARVGATNMRVVPDPNNPGKTTIAPFTDPAQFEMLRQQYLDEYKAANEASTTSNSGHREGERRVAIDPNSGVKWNYAWDSKAKVWKPISRAEDVTTSQSSSATDTETDSSHHGAATYRKKVVQ